MYNGASYQFDAENRLTSLGTAMTDPLRWVRDASGELIKPLPPLLRYPLRLPFPISGSLVGAGAGMGHSMLGREE